LITKQNKDEHLERLWYARERGEYGLKDYRTIMGKSYSPECVGQLESEGFIARDKERESVEFTDKGEAYTQQLIRAHRIAERLIHDVLGREFESGACEFEHIVDTDLVDSICTLLGHPRECPHGFPIPEGVCCRQSAKTVNRVIVPLSEMKVGQAGRIAYVYAGSDQLLHRLASLQIRPGSTLRLHQVYPSFVVECEGANVAFDADVARNINVTLREDLQVAALSGVSGGFRGFRRQGNSGRRRGLGRRRGQCST
jgi:DtxR family Mn-dependent transcriptional regulator